MKVPRLLITSGEPAGIGPEIVVRLLQDASSAEVVVLGDPELLSTSAKSLGLSLAIKPFDEKAPPLPQEPGTLKIIPLTLRAAVTPGTLNKDNAPYVMNMLGLAHEAAMRKTVDAIVTAPVHKGILNDAGFAFQGHTEFFAERAQCKHVVMLFVTAETRVALVTTHLPLAKVPEAITPERLEMTLNTLFHALPSYFSIAKPRIAVCGLNPHAGEQGHLGREELEVIIPVLEKLRREGKDIVGPLSADTIFTKAMLTKADVILAMYHDQALPVVKLLSFGHAVNVSVGLPYVRTSVDHGTALDIAGKGVADAGSLREAVRVAGGMCVG